ncbi:MAG: alkaline phosphatase, partial [Undibacterium sp.]|nr:alkaline phosphatase [Undibacterium sp.]
MKRNSFSVAGHSAAITAAITAAIAASLTLVIAGCSSNNPVTAPAVEVPKNVIFFLGDGMGMTTMTAARIYAVGEDGDLTMDTLPETAFIKTFSNDAQV